MRKFKKICLFLLLCLPILVYGETYDFNESIIMGNGYISKSVFKDRHKYLIMSNQKFVMEDNGQLSIDNRFRNGGFLSQREFCISTGNNNCQGSTYLIIPSSYWTLTRADENRMYYISNISGLKTQHNSDMSSVRVTEFVKPRIEVKGSGKYTDPWIFDETYFVVLTSRNKNQAYFGNASNRKSFEEKYASSECIKGSGFCANFDINVLKGYENNPKDGCGLNLISNNKINNNTILKKYELSNIKSDINCVVMFRKKEFDVNYNCSPGTGNIPSQKVAYGSNLTITNQNCRRGGYIQKNWKDLAGNTWNSGSTVKFDYDHGENGIVDHTFALNANWEQCPANTYKSALSTKNECEPCAKGHRSNAGASECEKQSFTITLNPNTGNGDAYSVTVKYGDTVTLSNRFTKAKYKFNGWNTKADGTGIDWSSSAFTFNYIAGDHGIASNNTVTLYAKWKMDSAIVFSYTGSFSYQDGSGAAWINKNNTSVEIKQPNWQIKFLSSGTLTVNSISSNADVFLVGGGGGAGGCGNTRGGGGGGGGFTTTQTNISLAETGYWITVANGGGCGGRGGTSSAFGYSAAGGYSGSSASSGGSGGSGGGGCFGGNAWPYPTGDGGSNGGSGSTGQTNSYTAGRWNSSGGSGCSSNRGCKKNGSICYNTSAFCESGNAVYAGGGAGFDHEYCGMRGNYGGGGNTGGACYACGCWGSAPFANTGGGGTNSGGATGIVILRNHR